MAHAPAGGHRGMSAKAATGDGGMTDGRLENGRINGRLGNGRLGVSAMAVTRRNGLRLPERMPLTTWRRIGDQIALIGNASAWWLGDWVIYGQDKYPEIYRQAVEETALNYQTLRNYAWIARRFPPSRRRDTLSFQHHAAVATLTESEQDVWLDRAETFRWSLSELRKQLRMYRNGTDREPPRNDLDSNESATLQIKVPVEQILRWQSAADVRRLDFLDWVVLVMDKAAAETDCQRFPRRAIGHANGHVDLGLTSS
jgi:hypothetical protein